MNKAVSDAIEFMEAREEVPYPQIDALIAELEAAEAKIAAVRELHRKDDRECAVCRDTYGDYAHYPCPTIAALDGTNA